MKGWLFLALVLGVAPVYAEPIMRIGSSFYYIDGGSALLLTEQMNQKGPTGEDGRHHPSRTKWDAQWQYRHNMHDGVCKMEEVAVAVGITTVRPRWRGEQNGPTALRERWKQMMEAVDRYQAFHKDQAARAGKEIEDVLMKVAPEKTCEGLTETANKAAIDILHKYKAASEGHDRQTEYGRKDGIGLI